MRVVPDPRPACGLAPIAQCVFVAVCALAGWGVAYGFARWMGWR